MKYVLLSILATSIGVTAAMAASVQETLNDRKADFFPNEVHLHHQIRRVQVGFYLPAQKGMIDPLPLKVQKLSPLYLAQFEANGKPREIYNPNGERKSPSPGLAQLFAPVLNIGNGDKLSQAERTKYQAIYQQIKRAVNREVPTPRGLYFLEASTGPKGDAATNRIAIAASIHYEQNGKIYPNGAYDIANTGTAQRLGWANTPCAETAIETVKQAYQRAGYNFFDDFNTEIGNPIQHSMNRHVGILARALVIAGWAPWDYTKYRAPIGAIMISNYNAGASDALDGIPSNSMEGHVYIAAGLNGTFVQDNGGEEGRDLRNPEKFDDAIGMYNAGVFFLPPGITPQAW